MLLKDFGSCTDFLKSLAKKEPEEAKAIVSCSLEMDLYRKPTNLEIETELKLLQV